MQNTYQTQAPVSAAATTVVKNDTAAPVPSIKLGELVVPATVKASSFAPAALRNQLASMEQARISWETTELAASNKRLYGILSEAYSFYLEMKQSDDKETRKSCMDALVAFINERGYTFMPSTHDMTRVVKCVFGVDRRRVSAYSIALREALRQEIGADELVAFIEENGGVEQIRMGGSKPLSAKVRADKAKSEVLGSDLGMLKFDPAVFCADADWTDKQVVIVATYLPTGEFQANAVIKHDSAVNAALAAYYSQQQAKLREIARDEREVLKQEAKEAAKSTPKLTSEEKMEKQKAKVVAAKAEANRVAANIAHAAIMFEEVRA